MMLLRLWHWFWRVVVGVPEGKKIAPFSSAGKPFIGQFWDLRGVGVVEIVKTGKVEGFEVAAVVYIDPNGDHAVSVVSHFVDNATLLEHGPPAPPLKELLKEDP
jgi:hypothetical protein